MKIEITGRGIYGKNGEVPIGTVVELKEEPKGWAGRYRVISGDDEGKASVTNGGLSAKHRGGGRYSVMKGDEEVLPGLSKEDAEAFNGMSEEDKAAYVASEKPA